MSPPRQSFLAADRDEWAASSSGYWSLVLNIPITWCTATGINLCTNMATVFIFRIGWKLSSVFKRECKLFIISCSLISLISAEYRSLQLSAVIDKKLMFCRDQAVSSYKVLGLTLCDTLKWNDNTNDIVSKASKRLHILRVLKRAGVPPADLVTIYSALVRSVLEYSSVVWATCLPRFLIDQLEAIQKRALRIVYPDLHYQQALAQANITSLEDRRAHLCLKVWHNIKNNPA